MTEKKTETPYRKCVIKKKREGKTLEQSKRACKDLKQK